MCTVTPRTARDGTIKCCAHLTNGENVVLVGYLCSQFTRWLVLYIAVEKVNIITNYGSGSSLEGIVSSPNQTFCARPADSSKNRVWTLSLRKLGQVYIWRAVNWVIVGVNYIISNQQRLLWRQNICKLAIYDDE